MSTKTEQLHTEGFIISEWDPDFSREVVTINSGTASVRAGTLAAKLNSNNEYVNYNPGQSDGSQTLLGIFCDTYIGATPAIGTAPGKGVIIARDAVVNADRLDWNGLSGSAIQTAIASLKAINIIPRRGE